MHRKVDQGSTQRSTVLVTGAAGTVGGFAVRELCALGHRVIASDRAGSQFDFGSQFEFGSVEVRTGDLTDLGFCVDVVAGVDAVIHLAAAIDLMLPEAALKRINVDATTYLYEAARARGCRRFVFTSSGSIYEKIPSQHSGRRTIAESSPILPQTPYEQTKADAERYLMDRRSDGNTDVVIVRPSMIYGPRARLLGAKAATLPPVLGLFFKTIPRLRGGAICNWVHAEDVARATVHLLGVPEAAWQTYNVADDTAVSFGEVLETITRAYGLPMGRDVPLPTRVLQQVGPMVADLPSLLRVLSMGQTRLWKHIVERDGLVPAINAEIDRETFLYAALEAIFDTTKLRATGYTLKWKSFRDGYPDVMKWFQEHRWLPTYMDERRGEKREQSDGKRANGNGHSDGGATVFAPGKRRSAASVPSASRR